MRSFSENYRGFVENVSQSDGSFGFSLDRLAQVEPYLRFFYRTWWRVNLQGLNHLPPDGPGLIVGNAAGILPWSAFMLLYALMSRADNPRRLSIMCDMDWIEDERLYLLLREIGCVPWSADNARELFASGELVALFPEGMHGMTKGFAERYRLRQFDWTKFLPAVQDNVPVYPLSALGCDEAIPILASNNCKGTSPNSAIPFFTMLPFPLGLFTSLPVSWQMRIAKPNSHSMFDSNSGGTDQRERFQDISKQESAFIQGEIQAELNRLLRMRIKSI